MHCHNCSESDNNFDTVNALRIDPWTGDLIVETACACCNEINDYDAETSIERAIDFV